MPLVLQASVFLLLKIAEVVPEMLNQKQSMNKNPCICLLRFALYKKVITFFRMYCRVAELLVS